MAAKILIINGSLGGSSGNTAQAISLLEPMLRKKCRTGPVGDPTKIDKAECEIQILHLRNMLSEMIPLSSPNLSVSTPGPDLRGLKDSWLQSLQWADALVFSTGTYWDSWGSPLQIFLENVTSSEGTAHWLGKPAICMVTMHSVGGKGVLARLQSVVTSFGAMIPPMSGIAYSMAGHEMLKSPNRDESFDHDIWSLEDLETICDNFLSTLRARLAGHLKFHAWPVDHRDPSRLWLTLDGERDLKK